MSTKVPSVRVAELDTRADLQAASALARRLWPSSSPGSPNTLAALAYSGNYVAGAFVGDQLVGACFGWLGRRDGRELLFSRLHAVDPLLQNQGIGFRIKQHQRAWALEREIDLVQWTFDPLLARNAYFALCKLGADVSTYHRDFNGRGCDRVVAAWELRSEAARAAAAGQARRTDLEVVRAGGASTLVAVGADGVPEIRRLAREGSMLCAVPSPPPEKRGPWRAAYRATLEIALGDGWKATGFARPGVYVLTRSEFQTPRQRPLELTTGI